LRCVSHRLGSLDEQLFNYGITVWRLAKCAMFLVGLLHCSYAEHLFIYLFLILFHRSTIISNIGCRTCHMHKCITVKLNISNKVTVINSVYNMLFTTVTVIFQHINHHEHMYNYNSLVKIINLILINTSNLLFRTYTAFNIYIHRIFNNRK
jgi:hypothetical protein